MRYQVVFIAVCVTLSTLEEGGDPIVKPFPPLLKTSVSSGSTNVARGKHAYQSSTDNGGNAERATDGSTSGAFSGGSCTETRHSYSPWLAIDLGEVYHVRNIVIYSRTDACCASRLSAFSVMVSGGVWCDGRRGHGFIQCAYHEDVVDNFTDLSCNAIGRTILIQLQKTEVLNLCEVEVYTYESTNVAFGMPTNQSSTDAFSVGKVSLSFALALLTQLFCTPTLEEQDPWWTVDLLLDYKIDRVVICLKQAHLVVYVDEDVCYDNDGEVSSKLTLTCGSVMTGSLIRIQLRGTASLKLCKVQVYGVPINIDYPCGIDTLTSITNVQAVTAELEVSHIAGHVNSHLIDTYTSMVGDNFGQTSNTYSTHTDQAMSWMTSRSDDGDSSDSPYVMSSSDDVVFTSDGGLGSSLSSTMYPFEILSSHVSVYGGSVATSVLTTGGSTDTSSSSIYPYTTTSSMSGARTVTKQCLCRCKTSHPQTLEELQDTVDELQANLAVDKANTSSNRRKRTSAKDARPSALYLGTLGIVMYVIVFAFLFLSDVISLWKRGSRQGHVHSTTMDQGT